MKGYGNNRYGNNLKLLVGGAPEMMGYRNAPLRWMELATVGGTPGMMGYRNGADASRSCSE